MRALITGVAGFIGSSIADELLATGSEVVGIDTFTTYYDETIKRANLEGSIGNDRFELVEIDLYDADLSTLVEDVDVVFHQAAQPGVRLSWGDHFDVYTRENVLVTQRLLESVARSQRGPRLVYASSSSVYGNAVAYPTTEEDLPRPHSPYGVTKLAAEHLCRLYAANHDVMTVALRYFTVYGPRQRPDMAFHRLCESALGRGTFPLYGDGSQIRDFTYISDVVAANLAAAVAPVDAGTVVNIAGGSNASMNEVIEMIGSLAGDPVEIHREGSQRGDVHRTGGSTERARALLGWMPQVEIETGLRSQLEYQRTRPPTMR